MKHYLEPADRVLEEVHSSPTGLTAEDAAKRLANHGPNKLDDPPQKSLAQRFLEQFKM